MIKKEKGIRLANGLLFLALLAGMMLYMHCGGLPIKGAASSIFVLMGLVNLGAVLKKGARPRGFPLLMVSGLMLSMLGDILLGIFFPWGVGLFALGHVSYLLGYCCLQPYEKKDFWLGSVLFFLSAALLLFAPCFAWDQPSLLLLLLAYALIISLMLGKAIGNFMAGKKLISGLLLIGSALFFFSDLMLVFYLFGDGPRVMDQLCLLSYFPAQGLLALSVCAYHLNRGKK